MTCKNFMLMTVTRLPEDETFKITEVNGTSKNISVTVPTGDYWAETDELDLAFNDEIGAALVAAGEIWQEPVHIFEGKIQFYSDGSDSITLDFSGAPLTASLLRLDDSTPYAITSTATTIERTIQGVVWGSQPLLTYSISDAFKRGVFYTDAGEIYTCSRLKRQTISFEVRVEGRPQSEDSSITEYHDLIDWFKLAAQGLETRIYPCQNVSTAFIEGSRYTQNGYQLFQVSSSRFSPSPSDQRRRYHTLSIEGKII